MMKRISHHGRKTPTPTKKKRLAKKTEDIKQNNGTIFDFWKRKNQEHIEAKKRKLSEQIPSNHGRSLRGRASSEGGAKLRDNNKGCRQKRKQYIYRHCPNRREGGQPHFKKLKRHDFLTKVREGGGHQTYCQK